MARSISTKVRISWLVLFTLSFALACVPKEPGPASRSQVESAGPPEPSLHLAALEGDAESVRQHIAAGSALDKKDEYGSTPLTIAITFGRTEVAKALIDAGADLAVTDRYGSTPLHLAAFFSRPEIAEMLLTAGADKRARSNSGATPFDIAQSPFEVDREKYDAMAAGLGSLGLHLDYARIARERPKVAQMLGARADELKGVDYAPDPAGDLKTSTPEAQGLDPALLAELFVDARALEKLLALAVVKNGHLVAEGYFNGALRGDKTNVQSVTKSFTSAAIGIALERGCLKSIDQKMVDFFPEQKLTEARKKQITLRQLLQMRAGFPWEETNPQLWNQLAHGALVGLVGEVPLATDPGNAFAYSNLSSHWLGVIVARACETDLKSFEERYLLGPLDIEPGEWIRDRDGYYVGLAEMRLTARDMAKFGLLYLGEGKYAGRQVVSAKWVSESLENYSPDAWIAEPPQHHAGRYLRELGYGYQWWSAKIDGRECDFAWGHGGQLIVLLKDLDMVVVAKSDPWRGRHDQESWRHERATLNLVGKFVRSLPRE